MTFLDLQNLVAFWLDDLNFGYFTPVQVKLWLNNAQREIQKRLVKSGEQYYSRCVQTTLVVGQSDYVLPDDFSHLHRLEIVVSGVAPNESIIQLFPITVNQQDMVFRGQSQPGTYRFKRNRLTLQPTPDQALVMRLLYSYMPTDMVLDTDLPDAPTKYHEYIALLATQDGFLKDGRASELLVKKLAEYKADLDADAQERNQDFPRSIIETGEEYMGGYTW